MRFLLALVAGLSTLEILTTDAAPGLYSDAYDYCQAPTPSGKEYKPMPNAKLVHLQLLIRHGDRSPVYPNPNEHDVTWDCDQIRDHSHMYGSYKGVNFDSGNFEYDVVIPQTNALSENFWKGSCVNGQLTAKGMLQHLALGKSLRDVYINKLKYLPQKLKDPRSFYIRSSDVWRTKQSVQSLLTGLYPVKDRASSSSRWTIPIVFEPIEIETLLFSKARCPRYGEISNQMINTTYYQNYWKTVTPLKKQLDEILDTGSNPDRQNTMVGYVDSIRARSCHNKKLPCKGKKCVTEAMTKTLFKAIDVEYTYTHRDAKLADKVNGVLIGWVLKDIKERMQLALKEIKSAAKNGSKPAVQPFEVFSGHDDTMTGVLGLLHSKDMRWPPYASNLLFELWQRKDNSYHLRIIFNGKVLELKEKWCNLHSCPVEQFFKYIESKTLKRDECKL
ncbi:hypothetical protein K7432_005241 [Basidiobolus ranarum]|uniref:Phosphoglycerate mutase-like protein n=1 Tax=Basidiobolus ranarum TaxID=34480 RepID=A0ABR2W3S7_9FUNG